VPGLRRGKHELAAGTLTPSILVRIQVPQPGSPVLGPVKAYRRHFRWLGWRAPVWRRPPQKAVSSASEA